MTLFCVKQGAAQAYGNTQTIVTRKNHCEWLMKWLILIPHRLLEFEQIYTYNSEIVLVGQYNEDASR
jgi:hypothetical protein